MKKVLLVICMAFCISCGSNEEKSQILTHYLPEDSALILKATNPDLFFSNIENNEFLKLNAEHKGLKNIISKVAVLNYFPHNKEALLAFTSDEKDSVDFTFISQGRLEPASLDAIKNVQIETFTSEEYKIVKYILEGKTAFLSHLDSISIISNSRKQLENSLKGKYLSSPALLTAFKAASKKKPTIFINHEKPLPLLKEFFPHTSWGFNNWSSLDVNITQSSLNFNGISVAGDSIARPIKIFKDVGVSKNTLAAITPVKSKNFTSFTFQNFLKLNENLATFENRSRSNDFSSEIALLGIASEAGMITLSEDAVFAIRTLDPEAARLNLDFEFNQTEEYRGIAIFEYPAPTGFKELLQPLLPLEEVHFFAFLDTYILFANSSQAIKEVVAAVQSELVLSNTEAYKMSSENLSAEATLLVVRNNQENSSNSGSLKYDDHPISAIQFIYQDNFTHVHSIHQKSSALKSKNATEQSSVINLDASLNAPPVYFKNHRTNGMDVIVQDTQNTLYLISSEGKIHWKKKLDSRILGEVQSIDILRNGRYQLAFATEREVHIIDRDGNTVKPFPLKFKDAITQPLSVFDYDNNRDYRFLVVQDDDIYMYDRKGARVKGFNFSRAKSQIVQSPKHIRLGRKDYILVPEKSGKMNILSRIGKTRVPVKDNISFSENEWYGYKGNFLSVNTSGEIIKIDEKGNIKKENLNLAENTRLAATSSTLVTLLENELNIKGKSVALDFGLYSDPQIFYINNKIYISVTDLQANKVYLFDSNANLLPGFPVYGNSRIDLSNIDKDAALELVVQGEDNSVLIYEVN